MKVHYVNNLRLLFCGKKREYNTRCTGYLIHVTCINCLNKVICTQQMVLDAMIKQRDEVKEMKDETP